jgi:stress response protein YsnF
LPRADYSTTKEEDSEEIEMVEDGSESIPVFEEELVIPERMVVRERIVVRKSTITEEHQIETELKKERVEIDSDTAVEERVTVEDSDTASPAPPGA